MGQLKKNLILLTPQIRSLLMFLFFIFLPTQLAKHFWPSWSYIQGIRIDYLSPTISIMDILTFAVLATHIDSIVQLLRSASKNILITLGLLVLLNTLFSLNPTLTLLSWVHLLYGMLVLLIIVREANTYLLPILMGLSIGSAIQLALVFQQFMYQSSLQGVWYWLGERRIILSLPDVAKISVYGREYLRPYGTFSHPNALGGFYALLFFFIHIVKNQAYARKYTRLANITLFLCPFLIVLSFSKVAILSFVVGSLILVWGDYAYRKCILCLVARSTGLIMLFLMFTIPIGDPYSLQKRLVLVGNALQVILQNPLWGVGLGNYILSQSSIQILPRFMPLYQPVHNIFLLIFAEIGLGGVMIFYFLMRQMKMIFLTTLRIVPVLMVIGITGLSDHYWVTLPQTQLLLLFVVVYILNPRALHLSQKVG
ncbi:O-antigen ligase family protein [Candidatus Woesebacteria bacterium]|nr:O-antigen ligase family protein [Candidatus Woesebacteria bacterium]